MISFTQARFQFHCHVANLFLRFHCYEAAANAQGRALLIRPDDTDLQFQRAWSLLEVPNRRVEGIAAFENLLKSSPSASGFYLLACGLQKQSRHEEAVRAFREAARLEPSEYADFHFNHAVSLTELGRLEEAADAYQNAAHLNPSDGEAWGNLGAVLVELGRWKEAVPCQQRAMRLAPSLLHGLYLGTTLYELDRLDEAERVVLDLLELDSGSTEAKELLVHVLAGQDRYSEALTLAKELCTANPVEGSSHVALASVLMEMGRLEDALQEASTGAELAPTDPAPHYLLGAIYLKMHQGAAALAASDRMDNCLGHSRERLPSSPAVWCDAGRGSALSLLGRHHEAITAFTDVLRSDPGFFERCPDMAPHYHRSSQHADRSKLDGIS